MPFLTDNIRYYSNFRHNFWYNLCINFFGPGGAPDWKYKSEITAALTTELIEIQRCKQIWCRQELVNEWPDTTRHSTGRSRDVFTWTTEFCISEFSGKLAASCRIQHVAQNWHDWSNSCTVQWISSEYFTYTCSPCEQLAPFRLLTCSRTTR